MQMSLCDRLTPAYRCPRAWSQLAELVHVGAMSAIAHRWLVVLLAALAGCATLAERPVLPPTYALVDLADSPLARTFDASAPEDKRALSGLRLLPEGLTALNARVALARRATRSLDVQ